LKIIFTLCSNNYLAQAKSLGDSLVRFNPDYKFIIGLVDELHANIDYGFFQPYTIIPVNEIGIPGFDELWKKYSIVEFNTCVKASYFKYIFNAYPLTETVCFFDPDIIVYHSLKIFEDAFIDNDLLLTPHIMSAIELDGKHPAENIFLNFGLYNLGFLGVHRNCIANGFLDWWEKRILSVGFHDTSNGLFVDQLWINFVPLFYDRVKIFRDLGLDVAPWNLHERTIKETGENEMKMMDGSLLYFYHFSSYRFNEPGKMSKYYDRYSFETHPELKKIYDDYHDVLIKNKIESLSIIPCKYVEKRTQYLESQIIVPSRKDVYFTRMKSGIKLFIPPLLLKIKRALAKQ
jgi:hypothetical protein